MAYADLVKMRERVEAVVKEELGHNVRVYVEVTDPPRRRVVVEVIHLDLTPAELEQHPARHGVKWGDN